MLATDDVNLTEQITEFLAFGIKNLSEIRSALPNYSRQSIYKSLKQLVSLGVVVNYKKQYRLNEEWLSVLSDKLFVTSRRLQLQMGESIRYQFNDLNQLERFWKTTIYPHIEETKLDMYMFNPHWIWMVLEGNQESELRMLELFKKNKARLYYLIGSESDQEKRLKKQFSNEFIKINTIADTPFLRNRYINIIGEYIFDTTVNTNLANSLDEIYSQKLTGIELKEKVNRLLSKSNQRLSIKIENNPQRAKKLKRQISKDFAIEKN